MTWVGQELGVALAEMGSWRWEVSYQSHKDGPGRGNGKQKDGWGSGPIVLQEDGED